MRMRKKILSILIVIVLFSNVCLSAVVSDNDGSAFITKAEFDSLKNNFQSQIDSYNTNIDNKIDNSIASYLAGIKIDQKSEDYYSRIYAAFGNKNPIFINSVKATQATNNVEVNLTAINRYYVKSNILPDTDYEVWTSSTSGESSVTPGNNWSGTRIVPNALNENGNDLKYNFDEATDKNDLTVSSMMMGSVAWSRNTSTSVGSSIWSNATYNPEKKYKGISTSSLSATGAGVAYVVHNTPAGNVVMREYASSIWPLCNGTIYFHQYKDYYAKNVTNWRSYHTSNNGMPITTAQTLTMPDYTDWGILSVGTSVSDESTLSGCWGDISIRLYKVIDGVDYSLRLWAKTYDGANDIKIHCINNDVLPQSTTQTVTLDSSTYEAYYYDSTISKKTQTNDLPANKYIYGKPSIQVRELYLADISNDVLTTLMGNAVYMGNGIPLVKCNNDNTTIRCKIKVATNDASHQNVNILISDDKLNRGYVDVGKKTILDTQLTVGNEYTFDINGDKDSIYWCVLENDDSGYEASIESFTITDIKS